jgi:hypothetical protein
VRTARIARKGVSDQAALKTKAIGALRRLQKLPHIVRGFFEDPHLRYVTA